MIRQEKIVVEVPLEKLTVKLVTVSKVTGDYYLGESGLGAVCSKRPLALALATRKGLQAFGIDGTEIKIAEFVKRFPDTWPLLESRLINRRKKK